ncbi:geranylgeranyl pyrophosphate synthetase [Elasticomyces elasticus]|nr:geranylgeranyl pyrophosphate synthetase [Elasticomyces elasticus]
MSAPTASTSTTFTTSSTPRFSLDTEETEDFDLGYDPLTFESSKFTSSRPPTAGGKQTPDSPTLGSAHTSPVITAKAERRTVLGANKVEESSDSEGVVQKRRSSRFVEEMASTDTMETLAFRPSSQHQQAEAGAASSSASHTVNPATIPIRTSSSKATASGEKQSSWRESSYMAGAASPPKKSSPRKHRSLMSVPEEAKNKRRAGTGVNTAAHPDERDWLAQGQRHSMSNGMVHERGRDRAGSDGNRIPNQYASTTFSQQPTLYAQPRSSNRDTVIAPPARADLIASPDVAWSPEKENILRGPYDYLEAHPGKDIRTQLITAFNAWLRVPEPSLAIITKVIGMLHTASLLIDDVEDSSILRRGVPVAHKIFGAAQTINSANYIYFCALQELSKLRGGGHGGESPVEIYTEELLNLHRGQGMDLFWRDTLTCPSEDDYLEMVGNKTGGLFRLAVRLMCAESPSHNTARRPRLESFDLSPGDGEDGENGAKTDYIPLVNTIGLLFQILDDYLNLASPTYTTNKGLCEDLTEGKFSFPVIHSIRSDPSNLTLINILKQRTSDEDVKRWAVGYMESTTGSFAYTRRVLRGLTKKATSLADEVDVKVGGDGRGDGVRTILEKMKVDRHRTSQSV